MENKTSVKLSENVKTFLRKFNANRIVVGTEEDMISFSDAMDLIVDYFKNNNEVYLDIIKTERVGK